MITDTKDGQTNYCPNCEDQARRIEELERRERMLVDAAEQVCKKLEHPTEHVTAVDMWKLREALNATPSHSEAWEWNQHVEFMRSLPIIGYVSNGVTLGMDGMNPHSQSMLVDQGKCAVAIPELKED